MKKIINTLHTLRGRLAVIALAATILFSISTATNTEVPKDQAMAAIIAVTVLCMVPAVIMWITGWKFANEPLSNRWAKWEDKHDLPNQLKRMRKAIQPMFDTMSMDRSYGSAKFKDINNGNIYHSNLFNCTCRDFQKRHLPCAHMYYLAGELELIDLYAALPKKEDTPAEEAETAEE